MRARAVALFAPAGGATGPEQLRAARIRAVVSMPAVLRWWRVNGVRIEAPVYPGDDHNEAAWRACMPDPLTFLLRPGR